MERLPWGKCSDKIVHYEISIAKEITAALVTLLVIYKNVGSINIFILKTVECMEIIFVEFIVNVEHLHIL